MGLYATKIEVTIKKKDFQGPGNQPPFMSYLCGVIRYKNRGHYPKKRTSRVRVISLLSCPTFVGLYATKIEVTIQKKKNSRVRVISLLSCPTFVGLYATKIKVTIQKKDFQGPGNQPPFMSYLCGVIRYKNRGHYPKNRTSRVRVISLLSCPTFVGLYATKIEVTIQKKDFQGPGNQPPFMSYLCGVIRYKK